MDKDLRSKVRGLLSENKPVPESDKPNSKASSVMIITGNNNIAVAGDLVINWPSNDQSSGH